MIILYTGYKAFIHSGSQFSSKFESEKISLLRTQHVLGFIQSLSSSCVLLSARGTMRSKYNGKTSNVYVLLFYWMWGHARKGAFCYTSAPWFSKHIYIFIRLLSWKFRLNLPNVDCIWFFFASVCVCAVSMCVCRISYTIIHKYI